MSNKILILVGRISKYVYIYKAYLSISAKVVRVNSSSHVGSNLFNNAVSAPTLKIKRNFMITALHKSASL